MLKVLHMEVEVEVDIMEVVLVHIMEEEEEEAVGLQLHYARIQYIHLPSKQEMVM